MVNIAQTWRISVGAATALVSVFAFSVLSYAQTPSPSPTPVSGPASVFTVYGGETLRKGEFTFSGAYSRHTVRNEMLASKLMGRDMPYRILIPTGYSSENSTERFPVIYLLHGLTGHFNNWTDKTKLSEYLSGQRMIVVTPEGDDGWYTDSVTKPNDKYESYIIQELIPEIDKKFRTIADRDHRAIAGLSMGGYGSIKFGLKYPEMFLLTGSFSGALDAPLRGQEHKNYRASIMTVFGPDDSPLRRQSDVFTLLNLTPPERLKKLPYFYVSCGTDDTVNFKLNREFADLLVEKKVRHEYRQFPGGHTWTVWDAEVQELIRVARRFFDTTKKQ